MTTIFIELEHIEMVENQKIEVLLYRHNNIDYAFKLNEQKKIMCYSGDQDLPTFYESAHEAFYNDFIILRSKL